MQRLTPYASAIASALLLGLSGCSDSGANAPTSVVIKPNTTEKAADGNGGGAADAGPPAAAAEGFGTFKGRVVMDGTPRQLNFLVTKGQAIKDADVCAAQNIPDEKLVVAPNGGVANVFVYLPKAPAGAKTEPPKEPIVFDQKGCRFIPHALVIRVGQPMQITSHDGVAHNTNIKTTRGAGFNEIIPANDTNGKTFAFKSFENTPVPVNCDFHGWMSARQLPVDHPFAAVTNENGEFEIKDLPAGTHRFNVWAEGADFLHRGNLVVEIKADGTVEQEIKYPADKFKG
jgi:hypothetical protein